MSMDTRRRVCNVVNSSHLVHINGKTWSCNSYCASLLWCRLTARSFSSILRSEGSFRLLDYESSEINISCAVPVQLTFLAVSLTSLPLCAPAGRYVHLEILAVSRQIAQQCSDSSKRQSKLQTAPQKGRSTGSAAQTGQL